MGKRKLKLFLLIYLLNVLPAVAQNSNSLARYNSWLSVNGLNVFFSASKETTKAIGTNNQLITLILSSSADKPDVFALASQWTVLADSLARSGSNIYQILLTQWATCADRPLADIAISIESDSPEVFSATVYYHNGFITDEHFIPGRGSTPDFYQKKPLNNIIHGSYHINGQTSLERFFEKLQPYFNGYRHSGAEVVIDKEIFNESFIRLKISHVLGEVTGERYHEIIYVNLNLVQLGPGEAEISYTVDVLYAGGIISAPVDEIDYRDASMDFPRKMVAFNNNLDKEFRKVLYGE